MTFHLSPEENRQISERVEKKVRKMNDRSAVLWGAIFLSVSLAAFLWSSSCAELSCATGYELIADRRMLSATLFAVFHVLGLLILLAPRFPDKFQFATLFTVLSVPLLFFIGTNGFKSEGKSCGGIPFWVASFFLLMFNWLNCGIKAQYRESRLLPFKLLGKLNALIQKNFDKSQSK